MVRFCSGFGLVLNQFRFSFDSVLARLFGSIFWLVLTRFWSNFGSVLVQFWLRFLSQYKLTFSLVFFHFYSFFCSFFHSLELFSPIFTIFFDRVSIVKKYFLTKGIVHCAVSWIMHDPILAVEGRIAGESLPVSCWELAASSAHSLKHS